MSFATSTAAKAAFVPPAPKGAGDTSGSGVRFTLRKRPTRPDDRENLTLSSYNSAFLSGLFADVAKASVLSQFQLLESNKAAGTLDGTSNIIEDVRPTKRSRLSLSSYRSRASCMNLTSLSSALQSPQCISEITSIQESEAPLEKSSQPHPESRCEEKLSTTASPSDGNLLRQDSLAFQLSVLEGEDSDASTKATLSKGDTEFKDVAMLAFPNLPATISDSSCYAGLTRENSAPHVPVSETDGDSPLSGQDKESSFGWFVDLDVQPQDTASPPEKLLIHSVSTEDLAFQAPTAPKRSSDNSEIEWAQAADTVDSVLGDLF